MAKTHIEHYFSTKSLNVMVDRQGCVLEDRHLGEEYFITIFRYPKDLAKELRRIANWLEGL
jgi:hypothetical protein